MSRANYHTIFDQATDALYVNDFDGNFIDVNESCCRLFGYTKKEFEQLNIRDLIDPEELKERPITIDRVAAGEHVFSERRMVTKSGEVLDMEINVKKLGDNMVLAIARDVTEMRKAQKLIALSEANYRSIFNQASDAIFICDIKGDFLDVNESFCRMFGYAHGELLQLNVEDIMEPQELKARPIAYALVATGQHLFGPRRMVTKGGVILDMELNIKMYAENRVLVLARDVTEMKKAQEMIALSEARFRGAFEHSAIGIALVSLTGEWLKVNKELCNIVGYTEGELLALTFQQITYPDDLEKDLQFVQQALNGEIEFYRMEKRYIHKNGSLVWINLNVSVVKDGNGEPAYFVSQVENITERKRSEEALKQSEANLHTIFDTTDTAYVLVDKNLAIVANNKYAADFAKNEIGITGNVGDNLSKFFIDKRKPVIEKFIPEVIKGQNISYEASYPQDDGSTHWYNVRLFPITSAEKETFGLMVAVDDITERKEAELQREKLANDLISRNKDLEQFTYILSHKVRSHVARLMGLTNLLLEYDITETERHNLISNVSESAHGLDDIVRDLNKILEKKK